MALRDLGVLSLEVDTEIKNFHLSIHLSTSRALSPYSQALGTHIYRHKYCLLCCIFVEN